MAAILVWALSGCPSGGGNGPADPARFLLEGTPDPCRIVFGPLAPDLFFQLHEVGVVDTPDGPTYLVWGFVAGDRGDGQLVEIDGVNVRLTCSAPPTAGRGT